MSLNVKSDYSSASVEKIFVNAFNVSGQLERGQR